MKTSYIYVISAGDRTKVGKSDNPKARARLFQSGNPDVCVVQATFLVPATMAIKIERRCHEALRRVYTCRGEWYHAECARIIETLITMIPEAVERFVVAEKAVERFNEIRPETLRLTHELARLDRIDYLKHGLQSALYSYAEEIKRLVTDDVRRPSEMGMKPYEPPYHVVYEGNGIVKVVDNRDVDIVYGTITATGEMGEDRFYHWKVSDRRDAEAGGSSGTSCSLLGAFAELDRMIHTELLGWR